MEKVIVVCLFGIIGGIFFAKMNYPGGAIVGSMLFSGIVSMIFTQQIVITGNISLIIQIILGISLGVTFDRSFLGMIVKVTPLAVVSTVMLLLVAIGMAYVARRLNIIDFATALFGFSPGGMSGMSLLAQSEGHKTQVVAFLHTVRIFTLFIVVPIISRLIR
ncbi:AbrB family transcriptional regulator [Deferribacteraceae bacterium V6Fe1]|nr:AbrB family transcriptional regulator [Deferribacteraceae bacterium V6Fe1]